MSLQDHLQPGEEILYVAHVTRLTQTPLVALVAVALAFTIFTHVVWPAYPAVTVAAGLATLVLGAWLAWRFVVLRSNEFVLTNHRMIQQMGILSKRSMDSRLDKINNIEHRQTLLGRLLDYGDVEIDTASETGITLFRNVAHPVEFKRAILAAAEQYRAAGPGPAYAPAAPSGAERMRQLKALLDDGLISPEEYEQKRRELLSQL